MPEPESDGDFLAGAVLDVILLDDVQRSIQDQIANGGEEIYDEGSLLPQVKQRTLLFFGRQHNPHAQFFALILICRVNR